MNKLVNIIEDMDEEELHKIKRDLQEGNIRRLINKRLSELANDNKVCPVCNKKVTSEDYKLQWGPVGMRMQARFDELDCLKHFLTREFSESSSS